MIKKLCMTLITLLVISSVALAEETVAEDTGLFADSNFSATLTMTSDYMFRGVSLTDNGPAIQGSFDYAHPVGFYAGVWASNWEDYGSGASSSIEIDQYIGYRGAIDAFSYDIHGVYYAYPEAKDSAAEFNYLEFFIVGSYTFTLAPLSPVFGLTYSYSPDYFGEDGNLHYFAANLGLTLIDNLTLSMVYGHQNVEGDKTSGNGGGMNGGSGFDHSHWQIGLSTVIKDFALDLSYHDTDESSFFNSFFGSQVADERVVFTVSRTF